MVIGEVGKQLECLLCDFIMSSENVAINDIGERGVITGTTAVPQKDHQHRFVSREVDVLAQRRRDVTYFRDGHDFISRVNVLLWLCHILILFLSLSFFFSLLLYRYDIA